MLRVVVAGTGAWFSYLLIWIAAILLVTNQPWSPPLSFGHAGFISLWFIAGLPALTAAILKRRKAPAESMGFLAGAFMGAVSLYALSYILFGRWDR